MAKKFKKLSKMELHVAILEGNFKKAKLLLENGASVNAQGCHNGYPIHCAAFNGQVEIVQLLVDYGANVNMISDKKFSPLHLAVGGENKIKVVEKLIALGASLN